MLSPREALKRRCQKPRADCRNHGTEQRTQLRTVHAAHSGLETRGHSHRGVRTQTRTKPCGLNREPLVPLVPNLVCGPLATAEPVGLPRFSFCKVDGLHVLSHAIFKFLLKQHKECTIKSNSPPRRRPLLTATSVSISLTRRPGSAVGTAEPSHQVVRGLGGTQLGPAQVRSAQKLGDRPLGLEVHLDAVLAHLRLPHLREAGSGGGL